MMQENDIKEGLSKSYVRAICNHAGYGISSDEPDIGCDLTVKDVLRRDSGRFVYSGINLDLQIKSTCSHREDADSIIYDLRNKNYNDLIDVKSHATKKILVVFIMPKNKDEWLSQDINSLILKKCAYWVYLGGKPKVRDSESTTAVKIPKQNIFSVDTLNRLMTKIQNGEDLT